MIATDFHVQVAARVSELRDLAAMVETFGETHDLPHRTIFIVNLALEELVTNTLVHGSFEEGVEPQIAIDLSIRDNRVHVVVESIRTELTGTVSVLYEVAQPTISC